MSDDVVPHQGSSPEPAQPLPSDPIDDNDRQPVLHRIQRAVAEDAIPFDELDERFDAVYAARNRAELDAAAVGLPTPAAPLPARPAVSHPVPRSTFSLAGDLKIDGWIDVDGDLQATSILGDTTLDLSSATIPSDLTITIYSAIGDSMVILPDGVRAVLEMSVVLGDRRVDLAEPRPGMPTVRVRGLSLIGDAKLYSLSRVPEGIFRRIWNRLSSGS